MADLLGWLDANAPHTERLVLVHGAYRTGNLLIHEDRVSAVLDWETQVIGDPMYDVDLRAVRAQPGGQRAALLRRRPRRVHRRYEAGTGIEIDDEVCRYYQVLYGMRSAAFWMSASGLFASGRNPDLRLARTAWSVPVVLDRAARDLGLLRAAVTRADRDLRRGPHVRRRRRRFHFDVMSDRWWETETAWFSFHHPERRLGGWFYSMFRPNIGTVAGGAWVWDDTA